MRAKECGAAVEKIQAMNAISDKMAYASARWVLTVDSEPYYKPPRRRREP